VCAGAGVKNRIIFEDNDSSFDGVGRIAAALQYFPSGFECAPASVFAGRDGFVRDGPSSAMNNQ
jgi:hypothetical protein